MDLDRKKKIAIITSIIVASIVILVICIWVLVAAITNTPGNDGETPSPSLEDTATPEPTESPTPVNSPSIINSPSEIVDISPTPSMGETQAPVSNLPQFSTIIRRYQMGYNSDKKTVSLDINFQLDEPGKVYIIAVDSVHNLNPNAQKVKELVITGEMLSHANARLVETVDRNDPVKNRFSITVGFNKVDIFIVLESSDGLLTSNPTKLTFTPSAPVIKGDFHKEIDDRNVLLRGVELSQEGYLHVLFIRNNSSVLGDASKLIAIARGEANNDLLYKYRSSRISSKQDISFNIDENVSLEELQNSRMVILVEAPDGGFDSNFRTVKFE